MYYPTSLIQKMLSVEDLNLHYASIKRTNKGTLSEDGKYVWFDIIDHTRQCFKNVIKIELELLKNLDCYDEENNSLNFDIFYKTQKTSKDFQPMYFKQPYKIGDNPKPLKSLLFPDFSPYRKWCFKNGNKLDFSTENVFTMRRKIYQNLPDNEKPVTYDHNKLIDTKLAFRYLIDDDNNISYPDPPNIVI